MKEKNGAFNYAYSAKEQEEIKEIAGKYAPMEKGEAEITKLRELDARSTRGATVVFIDIGNRRDFAVERGNILGYDRELGQVFVLGIIVCAAGIAIVILVYPIYNRMVKQKMEKLAPEILRISEKLLK